MKLYAGNLSKDMTEQQLTELFEPFGDIIAVNIVFNYDTNQSKGFGFVQFENQSDAESAIKELDGSEIMGNNIKVSKAIPKKKDNTRGSVRPAKNRQKSRTRFTKKQGPVDGNITGAAANRRPGTLME